jgi:riboflavin synthase
LFTGIVEEVGSVREVLREQNGVVLRIAASRVLDDSKPGASIAVAGVCQTVLDRDASSFRVAAEQETLRVTTLGELRPGSSVNLERALAASGRLDGHLVLGHVDGTALVLGVREEGRTHVLDLEVPEDLRPYIVPKGCLALDGVSLTVGPRLQAGRFEVFLIPYTWEHTTLCRLRAGERVNVETDVVARYVVHLLGRTALPGPSGLGWEALERAFGKTGGQSI